jgi:N-acetylglucosamine-6-phosphate deacetylase
LARVVISPPPAIERALSAWGGGPPPAHRGAGPIGLHLEGPFIASTTRGAHGIEHLRLPDLAEASGWSRDAGVWMVTLAPELPGAMRLVQELAERGTILAAGHSAADAATARAAVDAGVRYATHLFNAMPPLEPRAPGLVGALLADERVTLGLIADGVHVDPLVLALAWRAAGPGRVSLVSDAIGALDQPDGRYRLGGSDVTVRDGTARTDEGRLAGGVCPIDHGLRTMRDATGCSVSEVVATVTEVPARLLGIAETQGSIAEGRQADLALLTPDLHVAATYVRGDEVHATELRRWA